MSPMDSNSQGRSRHEGSSSHLDMLLWLIGIAGQYEQPVNTWPLSDKSGYRAVAMLASTVLSSGLDLIRHRNCTHRKQ